MDPRALYYNTDDFLSFGTQKQISMIYSLFGAFICGVMVKTVLDLIFAPDNRIIRHLESQSDGEAEAGEEAEAEAADSDEPPPLTSSFTSSLGPDSDEKEGEVNSVLLKPTLRFAAEVD